MCTRRYVFVPNSSNLILSLLHISQDNQKRASVSTLLRVYHVFVCWMWESAEVCRVLPLQDGQHLLIWVHISRACLPPCVIICLFFFHLNSCSRKSLIWKEDVCLGPNCTISVDLMNNSVKWSRLLCWPKSLWLLWTYWTAIKGWKQWSVSCL